MRGATDARGGIESTFPTTTVTTTVLNLRLPMDALAVLASFSALNLAGRR